MIDLVSFVLHSFDKTLLLYWDVQKTRPAAARANIVNSRSIYVSGSSQSGLVSQVQDPFRLMGKTLIRSCMDWEVKHAEWPCLLLIYGRF